MCVVRADHLVKVRELVLLVLVATPSGADAHAQQGQKHRNYQDEATWEITHL